MKIIIVIMSLESKEQLANWTPEIRSSEKSLRFNKKDFCFFTFFTLQDGFNFVAKSFVFMNSLFSSRCIHTDTQWVIACNQRFFMSFLTIVLFITSEISKVNTLIIPLWCINNIAIHLARCNNWTENPKLLKSSLQYIDTATTILKNQPKSHVNI